jgi:5'-nucleotidase
MNPKLESILDAGSDNLQIVVDFDRTLTCGTVNGVEVPSLMAILRSEDHLDQDYSDRAKMMYEKYRPVELDTNLSKEEKVKAMEKWWSEHYDLKIEKGLNLKNVLDVCKSDLIRLRPGVNQLLSVCHDKNIPVIIFSANSMGKVAIDEVLKRFGCLYDNIHVFSNVQIYDEAGRMTGYQTPLVHSQNKDESVLGHMPLRENFIVIGDGLHDAEMINQKDKSGQERKLYKIGIYEAKDDSGLEKYKNTFDEVWSSLDGEINFEKLNQYLR